MCATTSTNVQKFHPALSITNVKSLIPITLDLESGQYHSWSALFKVQARVHDVLEYIILPTDEKDKAAYEKTKADDLPLWKRLDAVVLQWIYATDNKNSRAMYLNKEFTNTNLADFSTANAYCNRLKSLADQLVNVGAPVNDHSMVLKMLQGLTEQYSNFVTVMQNKKTLPTFATARSKLALEETTLLERAKQESGSTALVANNYSTDVAAVVVTDKLVVDVITIDGAVMLAVVDNNGISSSGINLLGGRQPGVLGPRPQQQQAYATTAPTDIESAMHTMSLSQPDPDWYMDTGATSHMTSTQGNLSSYFNLSKNNGILVGSGQSIPIRGYGHTSLPPPNPPLSLNNVLHAPKLIKNLVSTGTHLMRCDSTSELYPITSTSQNQISQISQHSVFFSVVSLALPFGSPGSFSFRVSSAK
ncbi:hypothetical protein TSUD_83480 [Trifolium subterraneum]|uniref:Retrovirus-related Pol polyprotein from transposon TNT 1-94-like beta-barrel domain-containing protein n=1 Tax=Trifolium subterraneum TaxID=3900 RepID=A0A2Z6NRX7_TRISU|nr:hypothetical protein TSUD_83480 [Trifolium subterraneum]